MQTIIRFSLSQPLRLPLAYHHIVQGFLYHQLEHSPAYADFLHNIGYGEGGLRFRLFVFSLLQGKHQVTPPYITFYNEVSIEIRSVHKKMILLLLNSFIETAEHPLRLGNTDLRYSGSTASHCCLTESYYHIYTLSPITLSHSVDTPIGTKTIYLSPEDELFNFYLTENLKHKLMASEGSESPITPLELTPKRIKKYVTTFGKNEKRIYITAWSGSFVLKGDSTSLSFLYDTGLGARNSQGFGMFAIDTKNQ